MAGNGFQELAPSPRKNLILEAIAPKTSEGTFLATYKKLGCSFPASASAQDIRVSDNEENDRGCIDIGDEGIEKAGPTRTDSSSEHQTSGWKRFIKLLKKGSTKRLPSLLPLVPHKISGRKSRSVRENVEIDRSLLNSTWKTFTLAELQTATHNFSEENLIGKGGNAEVYKGCLPDGQLVAIKRLNKGIPEEQVLSFLSEIGIIAHVNHPHTAKMIGYGVEGGAHLVLQLSSLGSLGSRLHRSKEKLDWSTRYKIILGIAEGLLYLHENCQRRIIHRDIKADNILLSEDFEPQICDFGLSKWLPKQWSHHNATKFEGTFGYFAPEYVVQGIADEKTDIFSFGVLLLEIIAGRQALDESGESLVHWAKPLLDNNSVMGLVDPSLRNNYDPKELGSVILTATMCVEQKPVLRPRISQVIALLKGGDERPKSLSRYQKQFLQRTYSEELSYAEEYNSTKFLVDCNKHEKIKFDS